MSDYYSRASPVSMVSSRVNSVRPARTERNTEQRSYTALNTLSASSTMKFAGLPVSKPYISRRPNVVAPLTVFKQLTEPQVRQIVDLDVKQLNDRLFDRHMSLELTDAAKDLLAQKGFDPLLGARPLRRVIQRDIEDAISEKILMGDLEDGQRVIVDAEGEGILGEFTFKGEEFEEPAAADKPAEDGAATDGETPADATPATEPAESAPADSGDAPQE